jgi:transposase
MDKDIVGVDVSKTSLDVHSLNDSATACFSNDRTGFRSLQKWLRQYDVDSVVYEPTGPYHRAFEEAFACKYPLAKVNPLQARRFAQAYGCRAKTDQVDAKMLAVMGKALAVKPQTRHRKSNGT